jgi:hypothetical protein
MAITITSRSDEMTQALVTNAGTAAGLRADEHYGRKRISYFSGTIGALAAAVSVQLCRLPPGVRILGGKFSHEDFGTDVDGDFGLRAADGGDDLDPSDTTTVVDDVDFFTTTALDLAAAADFQEFGVLQTDNFGYRTLTEVDVMLTLQDGGSYSLSSTATYAGYVEYVAD